MLVLTQPKIKQAKLNQCSTSHPGGNLVDDLSPVPSEFWPVGHLCGSAELISAIIRKLHFGCPLWKKVTRIAGSRLEGQYMIETWPAAK